VIPDEVAVDLAAGGPAGIEPRGHVGNVEHGDVAGKVGVEAAQKAQRGNARSDLHAGDLAVGMNARVGTTSAPHTHRRAGHAGKGIFQALLDCALARLSLPTRKGRPVVFDDQAEGPRGRGIGAHGTFILAH
jgi:hypothetical protein